MYIIIIIFIASLLLIKIESALMSYMSMSLGGSGVLFWVVMSFFMGSRLIQYQQKLLQPQNILHLQQQGRFTPLFLPMTIVRMLASILLIIPGFFTDAIALLAFFPPITALIASVFIRKLTMQQVNHWMPGQEGSFQQHSWGEQAHSHYDHTQDEREIDTEDEEASNVVIEVQGRVVSDD